MTFVWLIVWLIEDTPSLHEWNNWLIALIVCLAIDFFAGGRRAAT